MFFTAEEKAAMKRSMNEIFIEYAHLYTGKTAVNLNNLPTKTEQKELKERRKTLRLTKKISSKPLPLSDSTTPAETSPTTPTDTAILVPVPDSTPTTNRFYDTMLNRITKKSAKGLPYTICPAYNKQWFAAVDQLVADGLVTKKEDGYYLKTA